MTPDEARARWATVVVLADGDTAYLRPITPNDAAPLLDFHERQPAENQYRRYFSPKPTLTPSDLARATHVDFHDRVALVLEIEGEFAAWASYERWPGRGDAEVAFMVDAAQQGKGIATLLLEHLAAIAQANGIVRFTAEVLAENRPMLAVFAKAGWPVHREFDSGVVEVEFPLGATEQFVESVERREQRADSRAMTRMLLPRSIAVLGASDRPGTVGDQLWRNIAATFDGPLHAVNPARASVHGHPCVARIGDIEGDVTLAVVAVPAAQLERVIDECIAKRVRGAVVITSAATADVAGTEVDVAALVHRARRFGMRVIGPASMGIAGGAGAHDGVGAARGAGLQATLASVDLPTGNVALSLQSGSLGASILQLAARLSLGLSWFVSLGDKSDVSGNDLLQFWEDDARTSVIAIYTESFGNPRKFARIARRVARSRPIVAVRTGAAASSSAADALYQQAGLIEVPTVHMLLDTARVLATQPVPAGPRTTVITNSRSPGVLAGAALRAEGLELVSPVQLAWDADDVAYTAAVRAALTDDAVDAVFVIHAPPVLSASTPAAAIDAVTAEPVPAASGKPVVAVMLGHPDGPLLPGSRVPAFSFPEPAAAILGRMFRYRCWLQAEASANAEPLDDVDAASAEQVLATCAELAGDHTIGARWADCERLLGFYGIPVAHGIAVESTTAGTADGDPDTDDRVVAAARLLGYPVAVKAEHRGVGRTAEAGIALDLEDDDAVRAALARMRDGVHQALGTVLVQRMAHPGLELRVHCVDDERLGPFVTVGLGGAHARVIGDTEGRLAPLSHEAAARAVDATRAGAALRDRGIPTDAIADVVVRAAQLMSDHPQVRELDLNPVMVGADGCTVVDAMLRVGAASPGEGALRRLL